MNQDKPCRETGDGRISLIDFIGKIYPKLTPSRCAERIRRHIQLHPYRVTEGHISKYVFPKQRGQRAGTWVCTPQVALEVVSQLPADWNIRPSRYRAPSRVRDQPLEPGLAATVSQLESVRDGFTVLAEIAPDTTSVLAPALDQTLGAVDAEEQAVAPFELLTPVLTYEEEGGPEENQPASFPDHAELKSFF